jgi:hypothetical protein
MIQQYFPCFITSGESRLRDNLTDLGYNCKTSA